MNLLCYQVISLPSICLWSLNVPVNEDKPFEQFRDVSENTLRAQFWRQKSAWCLRKVELTTFCTKKWRKRQNNKLPSVERPSFSKDGRNLPALFSVLFTSPTVVSSQAPIVQRLFLPRLSMARRYTHSLRIDTANGYSSNECKWNTFFL